jgi:hypothetical protein
MGTKSRETIYGASVRAAAERAAEARREADRLAVEAWNKRMLGFKGPAQPSSTFNPVTVGKRRPIANAAISKRRACMTARSCSRSAQ